MIFGSSKNIKVPSEDQLENLLTRGVESIYPNKRFLEEKLLRGEKISVYFGVDPTSPTLHLGHSISLRKLREFQDLGHEIIFLVGDFTGIIGDPTDKSATRKRLTSAEVRENALLYKEQAGVFISFKDNNPALIKYNSEWLSKMTFEEVIELSSRTTVDQMLKRDMFEKRMSDKKPIYLHEFLYPLLQGYDSVAMDIDGEIGGNDQTFNMLMGRDFLKQIKGKEKFVLSTKLLEDPTGKKMGKTEGNTLTFLDSPEDKYGKVMSWSDEMIIPGFELCTPLSRQEIEEVRKSLENGENPKNLKMRLAFEITSLFHDREVAKKAGDAFSKTFKGGIPDSPTEIYLEKGLDLVDSLKTHGVVSSSSEWRRLIDDGAVEVLGEGVVRDYKFSPRTGLVIKIGKKRFVKVLEK